MRLHLYMVVTPASQETVQEVQQALSARMPALSYSPSLEQGSVDDCLEFHATAECSPQEAEDLLHWMNNDPDGEDGEYWAYGFNTKMFDPHVYYFRLDF